jgi:hypothetical protein
MEIEDQLYHLYVHSMFVSNIESFSKMYKYIDRDYNRHLLHLHEQNQGYLYNIINIKI